MAGVPGAGKRRCTDGMEAGNRNGERVRKTPAMMLCVVATTLALAGCMHIRLDAASLISPDHKPGAARLEPGYRLEQGIVVRNDRIVAITRAHRPGNPVVIVFCGGDAFRRSREGGLVLQALAVDADVVLFDYPGYGDSTGEATAENMVDNARAVRDFVRNLPSTRHQRLVLYGFSLGGIVAAQVASQPATDALVLESSAADVASWVRTQVPWYAAPFVRVEIDPDIGGIDSVRALQAFTGPVLLLSGSRDRRAPTTLSRDMHRRLRVYGVRVSLHEVADANHGEIHRSPEFRAVLQKFLATR
jgi:uncharacterized protein